MRYYIGVDWADEEHAVWVEDEQGQRVSAGMVSHSPVGFSEWGRQLDEWRAQGLVLWAAIERPEGRVVDVLLDHGVRVYPVNPKALDRARDRFRQSGAKDDLFDARVLAGFVRTDHAHLMARAPSSEAVQELKLLTEDYQRQVRTQTRRVNQLTATLKAYYPRALDAWPDVTTRARAVLVRRKALGTNPLARKGVRAYALPFIRRRRCPCRWSRRSIDAAPGNVYPSDSATSADRTDPHLPTNVSRRAFGVTVTPW